MRRIAICTPIHRDPSIDFVSSLIRTLQTVKGDIVWIYCIGHANLARARNYLVQQARDGGATDIVFIDSDIGWEPAAFVALVNAPARIVAGCPQRRNDDLGFCGRPDHPHAERMGDLISGEAATAFLRVATSVFDELETKAPAYTYQGRQTPAFFSIPIVGGEMLDEDIAFSRLCRSSGIDVWLHPGICLRHWHAMPLTACMADHMTQDIVKEAVHG